jgi:transposase
MALRPSCGPSLRWRGLYATAPRPLGSSAWPTRARAPCGESSTSTRSSRTGCKASAVARDYEYVRRGTVSILAGIDLHSGHIFANVEDRHRSVEFIALLKRLDEYYPSEAIIRVVLDNHSAHISKETVAYLGTRPGRFEYVHTPKHGSWLNLIECAFSKMARTFLRHIRVKSIDELKERILKGIAEFNASPVVFRWNKFDLGVV